MRPHGPGLRVQRRHLQVHRHHLFQDIEAPCCKYTYGRHTICLGTIMVAKAPNTIQPLLLIHSLIHRNQERRANEASALRLIAQQRTIPVQRLLDHDIPLDGRQFLVIERWPGKTLSIFPDRSCSRPVKGAIPRTRRVYLCARSRDRCAQVLQRDRAAVAVAAQIVQAWSRRLCHAAIVDVSGAAAAAVQCRWLSNPNFTYE